ncbi:phage tail protein [Enterobacter chuandaensis]|uniref:tail fiber/spike domain-containing protein n=1 Tax=Enterobacter chuandaensis TaxID=2497875 RepID=UPI003F43523E
MATQPTNLPVPSESPRDLKFNAGKIDEFVTSENHVYVDRFGDEHRTIAGINYDATQAILNYGYITKDSFEDGSTISLANECLRWKSNGEYYRWDGTFPKVVPPGSTPDTTGGIGEGKWVSVGDASLRSNLAAPDGYQLIGGLADHYSLPSSAIVVDNAPYNGDLKAAWTAAPEGATLLLGKKDYNITGLWSSERNTKKNILIIGMGMPELASDKSKFLTGTGTVIQGAVKNQAKGFKLFNLGVDCGNYVSQNLYSSVTYEDAVQIYGVGDNANIGIDNVKTLNSLGVSSNPGTHSILLEAFSGGTIGYVECIGGFHGLAIKCQNLRGGHAHCYMQYGDGFIFKSDSGALCRSVHFDSITVGLADSSGWPNPVSFGGIYDAHDNVGVSDIHIGKLNIINASWGLIPADQSTGFITQVTIGQICGIQVYGNYYAIEINSKCVNWTISSHQFSGVSGGIRVNPAATYCHIGNGSVTGSSVFGYSIGGDTNTHGAIISNANNVGVEFTGGLGFNPSLVTAYGNNSGNFSALPSVVAAAPVNNWAQGADFKAISMGHMVHVSGSFVRGASSGANMVQFLSTAQPAQAVTLMAWSSDTGAIANVYVDTDGFLKCANFNTIASGAVVKIMGSYLKK